MKTVIKNTKRPRFWRHIRSIEDELAHQILFAELAFEICNDVPIIPGKGNDLLPYFYNLNFCKGVIALHSLLISENVDEICFKNYFEQYKWEYKHEANKVLRGAIKVIADKFRNVYKMSLRHKIAAHISMQFAHTDFTNAYIMTHAVKQFLEITKELKHLFFSSTNFSENDNPFYKIREQSQELIKTLCQVR